MSFNRVASFLFCFLLALCGAVTAHSKEYALSGGGGQLAIGRGLPLPPQVFTPLMTGPNFPPLRVPVKSGPPPTIYGTTATTKRQKLTIPGRVLSLPASQRTVAMYAQNKALYAVGTNLNLAWPANTAVLSVSGRPGPLVDTHTTSAGNVIRYAPNPGNPLLGKFGGPARFAIAYGTSAGWLPNSPVTIYWIINKAGNPPCTYTLNPSCIAVLQGAWPANPAVIGGPTSTFASTIPLSMPWPGRLGVRAGVLGTILAATWTANGNPGATDQASSYGYPWTVNRIQVSVPGPGGHMFTITGTDQRTAGGAGIIRLVAGGLSQRSMTGPTANRGWIELKLTAKEELPTMSPAGIAAAAGLMLLAVAYAVRRKLFR